MRNPTAILLPAAFFVAAAQQAPAPTPLRPADVVAHVKASVSWYRRLNSVEQTPALANDVLLRESTHSSALKALQLAFDFGRAAASLLDTATSAAPSTTGAPQGRNLAQAAARAAARVDSLRTRLKDLDAALQTARGTAGSTLRAQRKTVQAELDFAIMVLDTVNTLAAFTPMNGSGGLGPQIEELERSIPEAAHGGPGRAAPPATATTQPAAANAAASGTFHPESAGIIGLATELFTLSHNRGQLRQIMSGTDDLIRSLEQTRAPLLNEVRGIIRRGETLGTISGDEDVQQLASDQREIETLSARFKQLSAVLVPLEEQNIALGSVRGNLAQAFDGIGAQYSETVRNLLLRLGILALAIGAVVLVSALWRRITFRYIHDARRRTQFLTLRRVVVAIAIAIVVVLSFVTEFGSLATYAGLLTAGIAVALQNVILSVVAYFFLIGRYGIRSGDRVTISGVTGTVIDIGLVRIYLAELAGTGGDLHPTGRIVVYSNSVLFQPSALFKQMPETDYVWHTVRLVLTPESDFHLAETRLTEAVNAVYQNYRPMIDQQHANFERAVDARMAQPQPEIRLRYTDAGLEALVFYPAQIKHAALADNQIMRALQDAIADEPKLELATAGLPRLVANAA
jgi:small-conductance mechanosensitive channel